jgi:predicted ATPase
MEISTIKIDGFANLDSVALDLGKFNALVALNNYGKSNVIKAITFGFDFIQKSQSTRRNMMAFRPVIPINRTLANRPFSFEVEFITKLQREDVYVNYGFSFDWIKSDKSKGQKIKQETLKIKAIKPDSKYKTFIQRNQKEAFYLPSLTGRCDRQISFEKDELLVNKLKSIDELFYNSILKSLNEVRPLKVDSLGDPDTLFKTIEAKIVRTDYSLEVPRDSDVGFFIFSLLKKNGNMFALFKDAVKSLLPGIEDFEPIEIDLKKEGAFKNTSNIPVELPEKFYDILVKEKNNNQKTNISSVSSGSQKIFFIMAMIVAAELNNVPLIMFEEVENSIHPGLLQRLLIAVDNITINTKVLITSHSPYLIKYLQMDKIKIGIPNANGTAQFKQIRNGKFSKIERIANEDGISIGDVIFDGMLECSNGQPELFDEIFA